MSVLRPVGRLPARVYWFRRLLLLVVVVAGLLLAAWAWGAITGPDQAGAAAGPTGSQTPAPDASPSSTSTPTSSPTSSPSTSPTGSASPSETASGPAQCADSDIVVIASTSQSTYPAGQDPRLTVKVTNTSKKTCQRDVGQKAMEVKVTQGDRRIWSSDDCAPGGSAKIVPLKAGQSYTTSVVWSRTTSKPGCPSGQPSAKSGTYALTGRNLKVTSKPTAFALA